MPDPATDSPVTTEPARKRGVFGRTVDLFSSVWLGIWLLVALFIYSSIGSAGIIYPDVAGSGWNIFSADNWAHDQIRQWRGLEMTEFEWFHWWPFDLMMILIAVNIAVTTVRRIPFKPVNYGVWMIHTGILVLIAGSFVYFGLKVEGDAPVARRRIVAQIGDVRADVVASPGQRIEFGEGSARTSLEVRAIDPAWEILTGDDKGKRAYSVTVLVERGGARFLRQLIDGRPQLTEDLIFTNDAKQPVKRAVKELGDPLFDKELSLSLDYEPQRWFYLRNDLVKSWALYVRPKGSREWYERPIDGLPLYNDYIRSRDDVFQQGGDELLPIDPLDIAVGPTTPDDPLGDIEFHVHGYLRYADSRSRVTDGGRNAPINPIALLEVAGDDGKKSPPYRLIALDPQASRADQGVLRFVHLGEERELERFMRQPMLTVRIPSKNIEVREEIRDVTAVNAEAPFIEIKGSESDGKASYAYRVVNVQDELPIAGARVSLAIVELRTPKGLFRRWVFDNPALTRDVKELDASDAHGAPKFEDDTVEVTFDPGNGLALVVLAHGPEEGRLRVVSAVSGKPELIEAAVDKPIQVGGGVRLLIDDLLPRGVYETKPLVIRREERLRDAMELFSQIKLVLPDGQSMWVPFSSYAFDGREDAIRRAPFEPQTVKLADGREIEVLFSRQRLPLGTEVALEEFVLTAHEGGYTGETGSIRDYRSRLRFRDPGSDGWSDAVDTSMNSPAEHKGLWYFQAQWDAPDNRPTEAGIASAGLNYTVLGVANREGVSIQLLGCCIAVAGMIYAFYVKPVLKRRNREAVHAALARDGRGLDA